MKNRVICSRIDCRHNNYDNYCNRKTVSLNTKGICTLYDKAEGKTVSTVPNDVDKEFFPNTTRC